MKIEQEGYKKMATYTGNLVENYIPCVKYGGGIRTNLDVSVGDGATVTLPSTTTIGGSAVVALGDITSSATTGTAFTVTGSGVYTGTGLVAYTNNSATTGVLALYTANGLTTGGVLSLASTGTIVTTGQVLSVVANSATTSTGLVRVSGTGLTSGFAMAITSGGANLTTGGALNISNGASTAGVAVVVTSTGVMTTTAGLLTLTGDSATTASGLLRVGGAGLTSGIGAKVTATAATLTTGRYYSANDGTVEVFGIGANGHIHTVQSTAPTIVVTNQAGITAAAVTAGSSDVCGNITTTGTSTGATVLGITFNKTYTAAPKFVIIGAANAAAAMPNTGYFVSAISATGFTITVAAGGTYAATPAFRYAVIA